MANSSGMGLKRGVSFLLRLNRKEKRDFERRANEATLSLNDYARCKLFDIPFHLIGGKNPKGRPTTKVAANTPKESDAVQATE